MTWGSDCDICGAERCVADCPNFHPTIWQRIGVSSMPPTSVERRTRQTIYDAAKGDFQKRLAPSGAERRAEATPTAGSDGDHNQGGDK